MTRALVLASLLAACGDNLEVDRVAQLESVTLTPAALTLPFAEEATLTATAHFDDGTAIDVTQSATWTTSQPAIVRVVTRGLVVGESSGSAEVTATFDAVAGHAAVVVP